MQFKTRKTVSKPEMDKLRQANPAAPNADSYSAVSSCRLSLPPVVRAAIPRRLIMASRRSSSRTTGKSSAFSARGTTAPPCAPPHTHPSAYPVRETETRERERERDALLC